MAITHYSVITATTEIHSDFKEKIAFAGFGLASAGTGLQSPPPAANTALLVFHDAVEMTDNFVSSVAAQLADACAQSSADGVFADFERPVSTAAVQFLQTLECALQAQHQILLVPEAYLSFTKFSQPVCCWQPVWGSLEAYVMHRVCLYQRPVWLEYAPICQMIALPWKKHENYAVSQTDLAAFLEQSHAAVFYNAALCCNYAMVQDAANYTLCLFDTADTLAKKKQLLEKLQVGGTLSLYTEVQEYAKGSLPNGKEP